MTISELAKREYVRGYFSSFLHKLKTLDRNILIAIAHGYNTLLKLNHLLLVNQKDIKDRLDELIQLNFVNNVWDNIVTYDGKYELKDLDLLRYLKSQKLTAKNFFNKQVAIAFFRDELEESVSKFIAMLELYDFEGLNNE